MASFSMFQSAPRGRGETINDFVRIFAKVFQSAPRGRGETPSRLYCADCRRVSIRAPRTGRNVRVRRTMAFPNKFQSAPRGRGETIARAPGHSKLPSFNPRPADGAKQCLEGPPTASKAVSIRAPRTGRNNMSEEDFDWHIMFQSAPRGRGETRCGGVFDAASLFQSAPRGRGETT